MDLAWLATSRCWESGKGQKQKVKAEVTTYLFTQNASTPYRLGLSGANSDNAEDDHLNKTGRTGCLAPSSRTEERQGQKWLCLYFWKLC